MAFSKLTEDVSQVSKLGDHPKSDNGLSASGLKAWFDKAGEIIKSFLNNTLIPEMESRFSTLESWANNVESKMDDFVVGAGFLASSGGTMTGNINMGSHKITNLATPTADTDAANKAFVSSSIQNSMNNVESLVDEAKAYADSKYFSVTVTLYASSWVGKVQSVSVSGVVADMDKIDIYVSPTTSSSNYTSYSECGVRATGLGNGTVTFTCEDVPSVNLTVNIAVIVKS